MRSHAKSSDEDEPEAEAEVVLCLEDSPKVPESNVVVTTRGVDRELQRAELVSPATTPTPPVLVRRSARVQRAPDQYGEWLCQQSTVRGLSSLFQF